MKTIVLNGLFMKNREKAHRHIRHRFHFPDYYGANLDALSDCLGEIAVPTRIVVRNAALLRSSLGDYGTRLLSVLAAATGENPLLQLTFRERW